MADTVGCKVPGCSNGGKLSRGWCNPHYQRWHKHGDPLAGGTYRGEPMAWIIDVALKYGGDDCLKWPWSTKGGGRGTVKFRGKDVNANRVVCILAHGEPPTPEHEAAHSCGMGHEGCVNQRHLRWATHIENLADRIDHGTAPIGERNGRSILTESDVLEIRALAGTTKHARLGEMFGVSLPAIRDVIYRKNWSNI